MRYRYYHHGQDTVCVSSYAGKPVRGEARYHSVDEYDPTRGEDIARAKVDVKVAKKRMAAAKERYREVERICSYWQSQKTKSIKALIRAGKEKDQAEIICKQLINQT